MAEKTEEILNEEIKEEAVAEEKESTAEEAVDETVNENTAEAVDEKEATEKKGKKNKSDKKLVALETKNAELEDRVMRQMAEFENFRKRTEKEKATMFEMGAKSVIEKILPVVDNFERGLASIGEDQRGPVYDGMNMIYKQLMDELDKIGVKPIEALGTEFNPDLHNAVMQVESEEFEEGMVAQELQKGYTYKDNVVRHSMVAVAQ
ncbi:MAG: nucleotide exchange factor GrpE [Lachnospiraceae bacterium]|nr:nucleotide exchange factor GrpE [Candidatus Colinaster scatohippi]